ncbi:Cysteine-rich receptor-like protein kinase 26 [Hordeum vulgare]|nr:Cysteine-rich receptor-like protein kinase 26 [Hordeum vulgare]
MGKILDVDLSNLRRGGVVYILVAMTNTQILSKEKDDVGPFISMDVVVKLKGYAFKFRREPTDCIPDSDFLPFMWRRKGDDANDDSTSKEKDDVMDTSYHTTPSSNLSSSCLGHARDVHMQQVQQRGVTHIDSASTKYT